MITTNTPAAARLRAVCKGLDITAPDNFIFVDVDAQTLVYYKRAEIALSCRVSTSRFGVGNREGSYMTPPGLHRVEEKIGDGAARGAIFRGREDTGEIWREGTEGDNQILTRILRLRGLESGINAGDGIDSYDRYVYIHGTNREDKLGTPMSHGCVCMGNDDIITLYNMAETGTLVYINTEPVNNNAGIIINASVDTDAAGQTINENRPMTNIHFAGIFGSGMSAIAQYLAMTGVSITGSDRLIDTQDSERVKQCLLDCGCKLFPQDGSGVTEKTGGVCVSTAIEETNPDIAAARKFGIPVLHRSDVLASIVKKNKTIAVVGTSGKSTVTAMIFELLTACEKSPSLISGAALRSLEEKGMLGNAFNGDSDLLVIEADESDGTLVKYEPYASVILNISKDHKPEEEVMAMFARLAARSQWTAVNGDDAKLSDGLKEISTKFGFGDRADFKGALTDVAPLSSTITVGDTDYALPVPGVHNASNLLAALCVCKHLDCDDNSLARAAANYKGVDRRFAITHAGSGITVIDDFAHNPEKIRAAVETAKKLSGQLIAVYQPHGFGPTRFLKNEYAATFKEILRPSDALCLLPIYYAGGTAVKDIESRDIIALMGTAPFTAAAVETRDEALDIIKKHARPGGCVLIMGARDPSLPSFVKRVIECF